MNLHRTRRNVVKFAAVSVAAGLISAAGAYGTFEQSRTVSRDISAGQMGAVVTPLQFDIPNLDPTPVINRFTVEGDVGSDGTLAPQAGTVCADTPTESCASLFGAAPVFERGVTLDVPELDNTGSHISEVTLALTGSTATWCSSTPDVCVDPTANMLDGTTFRMSLLSCPSDLNGPGQIFDANPTGDDDSDPVTPARFDGPGPYTCSTGDFVVVGADTTGPRSWPLTVDRTFSLNAKNTGALASTGVNGSTFDVGQTVEMVTCVGRPDSSYENTDYNGLSADLRYSYEVLRRPGAAQPEALTVESGSAGLVLVSGCADALSTI